MAIEDLLFGLSNLVSSPTSILIFLAALFGGLVFGAIPGLSGLTLATIMLPFSTLFSATDAIMFFAVLYVSGVYGGAVTAILFNIPGSAENAPTAFDGYPMTLKQQSGRAIGAAVLSSAIGGTASAVLMMAATVPIANFAIRAFGPPEVFALIIFALCVSSTVGAESPYKGWLSVLLGLLLATVGTDPAGGQPRLTFGTDYLTAGINFVPLILGFFAVSEIFIQGRRTAAGLAVPPRIGIEFPSLAEFWRLRIAIVRSTLIGFFAGIVPGIGATLAAFLSYNEAVRWSRHPERFGRGEIEGVVAPETANNAATGAAMIPLLALGLPGGALTAVMLGAFQMHGMEPGPIVLMTSSDLVWTVFAAMLVANLCIIGLGYVETKSIVHLLRVPFSILAPAILLLATIGSYALRGLIVDVWVMFAAGVAGYFLRQYGYSMAGIVLGVILGDIGEGAFVKSMQMFDYKATGFLDRHIALLLLGLGLLSLVASIWRQLAPKPSTVLEGNAE